MAIPHHHGSAGAVGEQRYTATTTVLESPNHGPQLCLGGVLQSYPPQCGGPVIVGWDWDVVEHKESANGTTWGTYTVVGTWDGESFALTERPATPAPPPDASVRDQRRFSTPCPEPAGGWRVAEATRTSDEAMRAAIDYARSQPTIGGVWVDESQLAGDEEPDEGLLILNISFTDDLAQHEAVIRGIWGGALCVSKASISAAELTEIRAAVEAEVGSFLFSTVDEVHGHVRIGVVVDDGLQQRFDKHYGVGIVQVQPRLRPVDG